MMLLQELAQRAFLLKKRPKIEVFIRHCHYSAASAHKTRFANFTKQACHLNLLNTLDPHRVNITYFLDTFFPTDTTHFIKQQKSYPIIEIKAGTEAQSFLMMLDYICSQDLSSDTIIYLLEDDYLHRAGWASVLEEAFTIPDIDYVTLYDHKDKYFLPEYQNLQSQIFHTKTCHWRTTPSTTNTYAMRFETLKTHLSIHQEYSLNRTITADHEKFTQLWEMGASLVSSIPGWSTHMEPQFASPCFNWESLLHQVSK